MSNDSLESKTKEELLALAKKLDIRVSRSLLKRELIALVKRGLIQKKTKTAVGMKVKKKLSSPTIAKTSKEKKLKAKTTPRKKIATAQKKRATTSRKTSPVHIEDAAQEAKFIVGSARIKDETRDEFTQELPVSYGQNKLVLMPRDPYWVYAYWEIQQDRITEGLKALGKPSDQIRWVLRVFSAHTGEKSPLSPSAEIEVQSYARNWYLHLSPAGASFYAEIGLMDRQNNFYCLTTSNSITLPLDRPSDVIDEQWMTSNGEFQQLYTYASGNQLGGGSETVQKGQRGQMGQRAQFGDSSWGLSLGSFFVPSEGEKK